MKTSNKLSLKYFTVISLLYVIFLMPAAYAIPMTVNYQGYITSTEKIPLNDISINITFKFYDSLTGGNVLWTEEHQLVPVNQGIYHVILGKKKSLEQIILSNKLYLGISIENDPEMTPREELSSVLFSFRAAVAATVDIGAIKTEHLADNCVTSSKLANHSVTADKFADKVMIADKEGIITIEETTKNYSPDATQGSGKLYVKPAGVNFDSKNSLVNNILLFWQLDQLFDKNITDAVSSNDGTAHNDASIVAGKLEQAILFDGAQHQYLTIKDNAPINFSTTAFTISFWMKSDTPENWTIIMSKANGWGDYNNYYGWVFGNAGGQNGTSLEFAINSGNTGDKNNRVIQADNVFDNNWHHIIGMRNENASMRLYVDGVLKGEELSVNQDLNTDYPFLVGGLNVDESIKFGYTGIIDELVMWKKALSDSEISELFNYGNGKQIPYRSSGLYFSTSEGEEIELTGGIQRENGQDCTESIEGLLRYNKEHKLMEYCDGNSWRPTFAPKHDGKTEYRAGQSCKAILENGFSVGDGVYWIDPDGYRGDDPFEAYCDMTTEGGGWTLVAIYGKNGRPEKWTGNSYPRPGAAFYGSLQTNVLDPETNNNLDHYSINAKNLFSESSGEILGYIDGTVDDYILASLPKTCNFFDGSSYCQENAYGNITVGLSNGEILSNNVYACTTAHNAHPWENDDYNEFGLHLMDGKETSGAHCHVGETGSGPEKLGRIFTSFMGSDGRFWNLGLHSNWKGSLDQPGALFIR
jgi:hypothetical protein